MNDSENQKKSEKFIDFMNAGVMVLVVTAVVYLLFFAFNYGYNSFFALPVYFSTLLPLRMILETPTLFTVILLLCNFLIFVMPLRKAIKKILFSQKAIFVLLLLAMIANFIWWRDVWFTIFCFCALLYFLWLFSIDKKIKSERNVEQQFNVNEVKREVDIRKSLYEKGFIVLDNWLDKTEAQSLKILKDTEQKQTKTQHYLNILGGDSIIPDATLKIIQLILFIDLLFVGTVLMGRYTAMKEDSFLFIDEQTVVIDIYESNYVSIIVDYDNEINKYVQTGTYVLIPMDNADLRLQKKDGIQISALE